VADLDDEIVYLHDGMRVRSPTIWLEHESFSTVIELGEDEATLTMFQQTHRNSVSFDHLGKEITISYDPARSFIQVNGQDFLRIVSRQPLHVVTPSGELKARLDEESRYTRETLPGRAVSVDIYIGEKGEPTILPGEPVVDDEDFLKLYRSLIESNESFLSDRYVEGNYGTYMGVMAPIQDSEGNPIGLTIIEVYDTRIEQFKRLILLAAGVAALLGIGVPAVLILWVLNRQVLSPVRQLYETVNLVEAGDYSQRAKLKTGDELQSLSDGMNHMIEAIENHTRDLEHQVAERTRDLQSARDRAEHLLLNILPEPIAERLKENEEIIVDRFEDSSVLFADIVGFTSFSANRSPDEVVEMLNGLFSRFDALSAELGLEKIKTIGDAYMVAGGLPVPSRDHPEKIARMALKMQEYVSIQLHDGKALQTRIGIHCGPVIAGVIGTKKFIYDLWGDTVNTASRMESSGRDGSIQVSETFYNRTKDKFRFSEARQVNVKGKGMLNCYELLGEQIRD